MLLFSLQFGELKFLERLPQVSCRHAFRRRCNASDARLKSREELIPNSRDEAVLHFRHEDELFVFVNSNEQRVETVRAGDVTADDELLFMFVRSFIQAPDRSPGS